MSLDFKTVFGILRCRLDPTLLIHQGGNTGIEIQFKALVEHVLEEVNLQLQLQERAAEIKDTQQDTDLHYKRRCQALAEARQALIDDCPHRSHTTEDISPYRNYCNLCGKEMW